jgi:hypothetical protein
MPELIGRGDDVASLYRLVGREPVVTLHVLVGWERAGSR